MNIPSQITDIVKVNVQEFPNTVGDKPKVSVLIQTYEHAAYIEECVESVLNQKVDFDLEILLAEDGSKDRTREICSKLAILNTDKIRLFFHSRENNMVLGGIRTGRFPFIYNFFKAQGTYIALVDGDDVWIDEMKLQKQVNFLDENPEFTVCFHNTLKGARLNKAIKYSFGPSGEKNLKDGFNFSIGHTSSMVFRRSAGVPLEQLKTSVMGDWPLKLHLLSHGKGYYFSDIMSFYRIQNESVYASSNAGEKILRSLRTYGLFSEKFQNQDASECEIREAYSKLADKLVLISLANWDLKNFILALSWSIRLFPFKNSEKWVLHFIRVSKVEYPE